MDYKELTYLGLNEKEAKVYLAALELGKSTVQKIAEKSGVKRVTTYVIIEALTKKGLMSSIDEDNKQYFYAESPEKLRMLFQAQENEIIRKMAYLDKMLPELKALNSTQKEKPVVRYFEGKEGMRAMAEEFFLTKHDEEARMIYSVDLIHDVFSKDEKKQFSRRREDLNIKVKSIINDDKESVTPRKNSERIKVSSSEYPITSDIALYGNKIRIAAQKGKIAGLIIENKEIANTFKLLFDFAWKYLKSKNN